MRALAELTEPRREAPALPHAVLGAPMNSDLRAQERREAREARVQTILAERAERLAAEAAAQRAAPPVARSGGLQRTAPGSKSTPLLTARTAEVSEEELEKQKLRVACKFEVLNFFSGYQSNVEKLQPDEMRMLLAKLQGIGPASAAVSSNATPAARTEPRGPPRPLLPPQAEEPSLQQRLQTINDSCNKAFDFEAAGLDEEGA